MKPKLYYQLQDGIPYDNFCSDAAIGAREAGIQAIGFENELPDFHPYNILVGTVEATQKYLGMDMTPIDRYWSEPFENRSVREGYIKDIVLFPCFIKPSIEIKAWTGVVVENMEQAKLFTMDYKKPVLIQEVMDIVSEYRVYINQPRGIVGVKHYLGEPFIGLDESFVLICAKESMKALKENAYSLDFGVTRKGETFLIEVNDGWALGNYGLNPSQYYSFVKNRFLQLTGVLK